MTGEGLIENPIALKILNIYVNDKKKKNVCYSNKTHLNKFCKYNHNSINLL